MRLHHSNINSDALGQEDVGKEETDLRIKKWLSWQKIEQQSNSSRYGRTMSQSRSQSSPSWRNQSYLPLIIKQMETMPRNDKQSAT